MYSCTYPVDCLSHTHWIYSISKKKISAKMYFLQWKNQLLYTLALHLVSLGASVPDSRCLKVSWSLEVSLQQKNNCIVSKPVSSMLSPGSI